MAIEIPVNPLSFTAGEDLSAARGLVAKIGSADHTVVKGAGVTVPMLGIINKPAVSGGTVGVLGPGSVARAIAGAAVTRGAQLGCDASGKVIDYVAPGAGVTNYALGIALEAAAAADVEIAILVAPCVNTGT